MAGAAAVRSTCSLTRRYGCGNGSLDAFGSQSGMTGGQGARQWRMARGSARPLPIEVCWPRAARPRRQAGKLLSRYSPGREDTGTVRIPVRRMAWPAYPAADRQRDGVHPGRKPEREPSACHGTHGGNPKRFGAPTVAWQLSEGRVRANRCRRTGRVSCEFNGTRPAALRRKWCVSSGMPAVTAPGRGAVRGPGWRCHVPVPATGMLARRPSRKV